MRKLQEGEDMPLDFWNYNVNPIVGYHVPKMDDHSLPALEVPDSTS